MTRVPASRPAERTTSGDVRAGPSGTAGWRHRVAQSFAGRCAGVFLGLQGIDRAMAIAAQAFTALIPLLLLVSTLAGGNEALVSAIIRRLHLTGDGAQQVRVLFSSTGDGGTGVLSVVLLVFSCVSLTRRLQRMYLQAWRLPALEGLRNQFDAGMGLAALLVEFALLSVLRNLLEALPGGGALGWPVTVLAGVALWTSIPWLLLDRRIPWRRLLPGGALAALCTSLYGLATAVYMPRLVETYSGRYGVYGVTLAMVGWLLAVAMIVVVATVVAAEFDRAPEPWADRLRRALHASPAAEDDAEQ